MIRKSIFKFEIYQEPKKLAELQLGFRNFCGDFNACNKESHFLKFLRSQSCKMRPFVLIFKYCAKQEVFFEPKGYFQVWHVQIRTLFFNKPYYSLIRLA